MVVGIRNVSDTETLTDLVVHVRGPQDKTDRSHRVNSSIKPQDTITIGWVELDGWKLKAGDTITLRCSGYAGDATTVVPGNRSD